MREHLHLPILTHEPLECKWKKPSSGFDAKCHNLAVLPADAWQKTTVKRIQRRVGKNEGLQMK